MITGQGCASMLVTRAAADYRAWPCFHACCKGHSWLQGRSTASMLVSRATDDYTTAPCFRACCKGRSWLQGSALLLRLLQGLQLITGQWFYACHKGHSWLQRRSTASMLATRATADYRALPCFCACCKGCSWLQGRAVLPCLSQGPQLITMFGNESLCLRTCP